MMNDTFNTISTVSAGLFKEKGSKFLAFAHPIEKMEEVKAIIDDYRKKYHDARHVCYAYALGATGTEMRANDDGEPSGTAGRPILGQIQSFGLTNVLVVVVRYFGGVLLGTGGLVVAYKAAAFESLSQANIVEQTIEDTLEIQFEFPFLNDVMKLIKKTNARIVHQDFNMECNMKLSIRQSEFEGFKIALLKIDRLTIL